MLSALSPWRATAGAAIGRAVSSTAEQLVGSFSDALQAGEKAENDTPAEQSASLLEALRTEATTQRNDLLAAINQRLHSAGINLDSPLPLEVDAFGELRVAGEHAQADQIELLLNDDPTIRQDLKQLQSLQSEVEQLQMAQRAERLTDLDPRAAAALRQQARQHRANLPRLVVGS